jgi:hypothetical protein
MRFLTPLEMVRDRAYGYGKIPLLQNLSHLKPGKSIWYSAQKSNLKHTE